MPRKIPGFDREFRARIADASALVRRIELSAVNGGVSIDKIRIFDIELSYELAYLRVFCEWEALLESVFIRMLCGYSHSGGVDNLVPGKKHCRDIGSAYSLLLGKNNYLLWHNSSIVLRRASGYFANSRYEQIIASAQGRLENHARIRHRIAHAQDDAAAKFDQATMALAGRRYRGSRPGRFLRDKQPGSNPPQRWFELICSELDSLAAQICR